jgi:hypothetical protein
LSTFTQISSLESLGPPNLLSCGLTHSGCLINSNAYLWGTLSQQLLFKEPQLIDFSENVQIKDIKMADGITVFLTERDEVWVLGDNKFN